MRVNEILNADVFPASRIRPLSTTLSENSGREQRQLPFGLYALGDLLTQWNARFDIGVTGEFVGDLLRALDDRFGQTGHSSDLDPKGARRTPGLDAV
jgi:hypothetical protein